MNSVQQALNKIKQAEYGNETREPIHFLLKEVEQHVLKSKLSRLIFTGTFYDFITSHTDNQEVIEARNGHSLLGSYLNELDEQLTLYEKLLFGESYVPPNAPAEISKTSTVTFNIIRKET